MVEQETRLRIMPLQVISKEELMPVMANISLALKEGARFSPITQMDTDSFLLAMELHSNLENLLLDIDSKSLEVTPQQLIDQFIELTDELLEQLRLGRKEALDSKTVLPSIKYTEHEGGNGKVATKSYEFVPTGDEEVDAIAKQLGGRSNLTYYCMNLLEKTLGGGTYSYESGTHKSKIGNVNLRGSLERALVKKE